MLRDAVPLLSWEQCRAGHLTLLLCLFQPLYAQLPSRKWLSGPQLVNSMCEVIDKYTKDFSHVRKPAFTVQFAGGIPSDGLPVCRVRVLSSWLRCWGSGRGPEGAGRAIGICWRGPYPPEHPTGHHHTGFPQVQMPFCLLSPLLGNSWPTPGANSFLLVLSSC